MFPRVSALSAGVGRHVFDDVSGGGEAECASDEAGGAVTALAIETEVGRRRAIAADGSVVMGVKDWLGGIDAIDAEDFGRWRKTVIGSKAISDDKEESIVCDAGEIGDPDGGGIPAAAGGA